MVGCDVGTEGDTLGKAVGAWEGLGVDGALDGFAVGKRVGREGASVGKPVGTPVGYAVVAVGTVGATVCEHTKNGATRQRIRGPLHSGRLTHMESMPLMSWLLDMSIKSKPAAKRDPKATSGNRAARKRFAGRMIRFTTPSSSHVTAMGHSRHGSARDLLQIFHCAPPVASKKARQAATLLLALPAAEAHEGNANARRSSTAPNAMRAGGGEPPRESERE